jgi:hypothetical protein
VHLTIAVYTASATAAGAATGATLGLLGSAIDARVDLVLVVLTPLVMRVGWREATGRPAFLVQFNRETRRGWIDEGATSWAVKNGAALGSGFATRIGFSAWYWLPVALFAVNRSVLGGALAFAAYAAPRSALVAALVWPARSSVDRRGAESLLSRKNGARTVSGLVSLMLGSYVLAAALA